MGLCLVCKKKLVQNTHQEEEHSGKVTSRWHLPEYIFFHRTLSKLAWMLFSAVDYPVS